MAIKDHFYSCVIAWTHGGFFLCLVCRAECIGIITEALRSNRRVRIEYLPTHPGGTYIKSKMIQNPTAAQD